MTKTKSTFLALVAVLLSPMAANATPIISASGLASPDSVVDFESIVLAPGSSLTNEYASEGVTFSPNVTYDPQICAGFPGFGGDHCAGNLFVNPFTIIFSDVVSSAALGFATNPGTSTFSAYLGGTLIEQFSLATTFNNASTAYLGFSGILFDSIQIDAANGLAVLDNIQWTTVPEPGTLALLGLGLAGMGMTRRKKIV